MTTAYAGCLHKILLKLLRFLTPASGNWRHHDIGGGNGFQVTGNIDAKRQRMVLGSIDRPYANTRYQFMTNGHRKLELCTLGFAQLLAMAS